MTYNITISEVAPSRWDEKIKLDVGGNIFQTTMWAGYMKEKVSAEPRYLTVFQDGQEVAVLLYFIIGKGSEVFANYYGGKILAYTSRVLFPKVTWIGGPLFLKRLTQDEKKGVVRLILKQINGKRIFATFNEYFEFLQQHQETFIVDLKHDEKRLFAGLQKNVRNSITRSFRAGLNYNVTNKEEDLMKYLHVLQQNRQRAGLGLPPHFPSTMMKKYLRDHMWVVLILKGTDTLAAIGVLEYNGNIIEIAPAISDFGFQKYSFVGDCLNWSLIKWGSENNFRTYDLAGVEPSSSDPKIIGIFNFKKKFGGQLLKRSMIWKT
ncbi:MAG: peptidoglycan bridge formation glycyltransferase FemA/FemB family protein [DPANN group archaeon]|nr:peptidoglycan bridge formation glycyltransferase FemA/FemB family protein [DPANN group archaeon]